MRTASWVAIEDQEPNVNAFHIAFDDPEAYARYLIERWRAGVTWINVEHDIVLPAGSLSRLARCPHEWCVHPYTLRGTIYVPMLGLAKFSASLLGTFPMLAREALAIEKRDDVLVGWRYCSEYLAAYLGRAGVAVHIHQPLAIHLSAGIEYR